MSHKKRKTSSNVNIEKALLKLEFPLVNNIGAKIVLKLSDSSHSRSKHISKQYHGLTEKDIALIPDALLKPDYVVKDPRVKLNKNYYKRRGRKKKILFLKIVTKIIGLKEEQIITAFTTSNIKGWLIRCWQIKYKWPKVEITGVRPRLR